MAKGKLANFGGKRAAPFKKGGGRVAKPAPKPKRRTNG
jgi:hypothetical protein